MSSADRTAYRLGMGSMFNQWIDGQPWWMTLLLLPAIVLGAVAVKVVRYLAIAAGVLIIAGAGLAWTLLRRRR
jgi:hypothetical protein